MSGASSLGCRRVKRGISSPFSTCGPASGRSEVGSAAEPSLEHTSERAACEEAQAGAARRRRRLQPQAAALPPAARPASCLDRLAAGGLPHKPTDDEQAKALPRLALMNSLRKGSWGQSTADALGSTPLQAGAARRAGSRRAGESTSGAPAVAAQQARHEQPRLEGEHKCAAAVAPAHDALSTAPPAMRSLHPCTHLRKLVFHSASATRRVLRSSMLWVPGSSISPCSSTSLRPSCLASAASGTLWDGRRYRGGRGASSCEVRGGGAMRSVQGCGQASEPQRVRAERVCRGLCCACHAGCVRWTGCSERSNKQSIKPPLQPRARQRTQRRPRRGAAGLRRRAPHCRCRCCRCRCRCRCVQRHLRPPQLRRRQPACEPGGADWRHAAARCEHAPAVAAAAALVAARLLGLGGWRMGSSGPSHG